MRCIIFGEGCLKGKQAGLHPVILHLVNCAVDKAPLCGGGVIWVQQYVVACPAVAHQQPVHLWTARAHSSSATLYLLSSRSTRCSKMSAQTCRSGNSATGKRRCLQVVGASSGACKRCFYTAEPVQGAQSSSQQMAQTGGPW